MKLHCIADEDTVRGFRLVGVSGQAVATAKEAAVAVEAAMKRSDCGVLILTEKVAAAVRPLVEQLRFEREQPLILEIPGPEGAQPGRKSLRQLAQAAVGLRLNAEKGH